MEKWKAWEPVKGIPTEFYKNSLIDDNNGLFLAFEGRKNNIKFFVKFEEGALSYRNTDEGSLLQMIGFFSKHYGSEFFGKTSMFEVADSQYIEWFLKESSGIYSKSEIKHYVFFTPNDVIEVISNYPPKVEFE